VEAVDEPFEGVRNVDLEQAEAIGVSLKGITISDTSSKGGGGELDAAPDARLPSQNLFLFLYHVYLDFFDTHCLSCLFPIAVESPL